MQIKPVIIPATETSRGLMKDILQNLQAKKPSPPTSYVSYDISIKKDHAYLSTDENDGVIRNVSILSLKGIKGAIENATGAIRITQKPRFLSMENTVGKIMTFLEQIHPSNLVKSLKLEDETNSLSDYVWIKERFQNRISKKIVAKKIVGNNCTKTWEVLDAYKKPFETVA